MLFFFNNLATNINYLNSRVNYDNVVRKKINENLSMFIMDITPLINDIVYFKKKHVSVSLNKLNSNQIVWNMSNSNLVNLDEQDEQYNSISYMGFCNKNCYTCWVDELLTKFIYILLITAKFMGTGVFKDPNLYKLAEYYSNIFYTLLKLDSIDINNSTNNTYQHIFNNYHDYKSKLIYSIMELEINSDTIDEIIKYLDDDIIHRFLDKKII
jgi:hypothetical protein